jgi:hypothetical protein
MASDVVVDTEVIDQYLLAHHARCQQLLPVGDTREQMHLHKEPMRHSAYQYVISQHIGCWAIECGISTQEPT